MEEFPRFRFSETEVLICGSRSQDVGELRDLVNRQGYSVQTAKTPVTAIQLVRHGVFKTAILLLDSGNEVWLESIGVLNDLFPSLPIIVIANGESLETERKVRAGKIFYYLLEPLDAFEVRAVLRDATGRAEA